MADTLRFPNGGYNVIVYRKQDIIDCIDKNIIDKDIALAIVEQCEQDAANFINEGKWTSIPFIGNIRVPRIKELENDPIRQLLVEEAKETLTKEQYVMFRRQLTKDDENYVKQERYFNYIVSMAITKNRKLFKKLCNTKGERYARIFLFCSKHITAVNNEYEILDSHE